MKGWLLLTVFFGSIAMSVFRLVPGYFDLTERLHAVPASLGGERIIRNDAMGRGHFGASRSNGRTHNGIDILSEIGAPVLASKSGRVVFAGVQGAHGQYIRLDHPDGTNTRYSHLTEIRVRQGEWVRRKQVIGTVGNTGNADHPAILPHLHYEIRRQEQPLDPGPVLDGILKNPGLAG